ncbi:serine kinase [Altererythrobacter aurantiacus]|uniref:Serine kinase n=1 Tax=Parapontixanthobacter aurantiacus TaxID=1463599 RepID=A0A844ZBY6_9SPHN|nr:serine kinase [Parapontixanthobacter aurantiacus]MXO84772.1 serine kinase [Parapontixanthobacter aurantiacus]
MSGTSVLNMTAVAVGGRALLLAGPPGSGKSTLALALIDRGAQLIGDDGVLLEGNGDHLIAQPPEGQTRGLLEVHGVGLVSFAVTAAPVALILESHDAPPRLPETVERRTLLDIAIPVVPFDYRAPSAVLRAELALRHHGLPLSP